MLKITTDTLDEMVMFSSQKEEWDEPAMLILCNEDAEKFIFLLAGGGDPKEMMPIITAGVQAGRIPITGPIVSAVLVFEGWALSGKVSETSGVGILKEAADLYAHGKGVADHPAAKEVKGFFGVDAEGSELRSITRGVPGINVSSHGEGAMEQALRELLEGVNS